MARSVNAPFLRARPLALERVAPSPRVPSAANEARIDASCAVASPAGGARRRSTLRLHRARKRRQRE